jgi:hypothetical protein
MDQERSMQTEEENAPLAARVVTVDPLPDYLQGISEPRAWPMFKAMMGNFGKELSSWEKIPCIQHSFYSGLLVGGLVSTWRIWRTKSFKGFHTGFVCGMITSFLSWNYCRVQLNSSLHMGLQSAQMIQEHQNLMDQLAKKKESSGNK